MSCRNSVRLFAGLNIWKLLIHSVLSECADASSGDGPGAHITKHPAQRRVTEVNLTLITLLCAQSGNRYFKTR